MVHVRQLDPSASPLDYFGYEARRLREAAGMTLERLGKVIYCTGSLIGQVETASKVPSRTFAEALDTAFLTDGFFSRLLKLVLRSRLPKWFQPYAEMEAKAAFISTYQCQLAHGLLQTPEYAAALITVDEPDRVEGLVAARMERQRILERKRPPAVWVVLDESVLLRMVGDHEIMHSQLARLVSYRDNPWVNIQVLPLSAGAHTGMMGSFTPLRFDDDPDIYYSLWRPGDGRYGAGPVAAAPMAVNAWRSPTAPIASRSVTRSTPAEPSRPSPTAASRSSSTHSRCN